MCSFVNVLPEKGYFKIQRCTKFQMKGKTLKIRKMKKTVKKTLHEQGRRATKQSSTFHCIWLVLNGTRRSHGQDISLMHEGEQDR